MNRKEFEIEMIRQNTSIEDLCAITKKSKKAIYQRIKGEVEFKRDEIQAIAIEWALSDMRLMEIFFSQKVA